jgi:hypothetical protein
MRVVVQTVLVAAVCNPIGKISLSTTKFDVLKGTVYRAFYIYHYLN